MGKRNANQPLRRFHALGKRVLRKSAGRQRRGEGIHGTLASLNAATLAEKNRLMEARHFAKLYDGEQLDWICSLGHNVGQPLTRTQVKQLMRVANQRQRNRLAKECAEQAWTVRRLELEVRRIGPARGYGGRRHEPPHSVEGALRVTERMASSWIRWGIVLTPATKGAPIKGVSLQDLPKSIQKQLMAVLADITKLRDKIRRSSTSEGRRV